MKNIRVEYSCEATVNTGNFTNMKPGFKVSATVDEGESATDIKAFLVKKVDEWLEAEVTRIANGEK